MKVVVGTTNKDKLKIVEDFFAELGVSVEIESNEQSSKVSEQPMGLEEIFKGAANRGRGAWSYATFIERKEVDFSIGLEAGMVEVLGTLFYCAIALVDTSVHYGFGISELIPLPRKVQDKVIAGEELSDVIREYLKNNKNDDIKPLLDNIVDRKNLFKTALYSAWITVNDKNYFIK